jgi:hypothetical protein
MCNEAIIHTVMSYVIRENEWWGSFMGLRGRKGQDDERKLYNEELHDLNTRQILLRDKIKEDELKGACGTMMENRYAHGVLVGKLRGKIPLGRPRRKLEGNIQMDFKEMR